MAHLRSLTKPATRRARSLSADAAPAAEASPAAAAVPPPVKAVVLRDEPHGQVRLSGPQGELTAAVSPHLPPLQPGQAVLVTGAGHGLADPPLVFAAWPCTGDRQVGWRLDPASGTLHLQADALALHAVRGVRLHCGDTSVTLSPQGLLELRAQDITASATQTHRIEGGSIELN